MRAAHREDVRVVVLPRQPRRVEIVAQRGADAGHLVGGDLLALAAAADRRCRGRRGRRRPRGRRQRRSAGSRRAPRCRCRSRRPSWPEPLQRLLRDALSAGTPRDRRRRAIAHPRDCTRRRARRQRSRAVACEVSRFGELRKRASQRRDAERLHLAMIPTVTISPRGEERCAADTRGSTAPTSATSGRSAAISVRSSDRAAGGSASALYSDRSQIALRMLDAPREPTPMRSLAARASRPRSGFGRRSAIDATAYRLVHGEADLLPSLIVDRYGD